MQLVEDALQSTKLCQECICLPFLSYLPVEKDEEKNMLGAVEMNKKIDKRAMHWMPNQARKEWKPSKCNKSQTFQLGLS